MSDLFAKIRSAFGDYAVDKSLLQIGEVAKLPSYVAEYLMTEFKQQYPNDWQRRLREFVAEHYYEASEREYVRHKLVESSRIRIIDELRVWVDLETGEHLGLIPSIGSDPVLVPKEVADRYPNILKIGMWGLIELEYKSLTAGNAVGVPQVMVTQFVPFQTPTSDPKILAEAKRNFTFDEWLDVLINTIGYNHHAYDSQRRKLVLLSRLLPLPEENVHMAEFGPKATGKTYVFRNVSRYTRIIVGGVVSPATLFYNLRNGMPGEIAIRDAVVFDEISRVRFPPAQESEIVAKLKDFMESGQYERGKQRVPSGSSIVMLGNVEVEQGEGSYVPVEDLTYMIPKAMRDSALIDRVMGVIPGWELPKIGKAQYHLSQGYGVALDYFSEALHSMRKESLVSELSQEVEVQGGSVTIRDERAIRKMLSSFVKLLFPDLTYDKRELELVANYVVELRQRVRDWLHRLSPGEFPREQLAVKVRG